MSNRLVLAGAALLAALAAFGFAVTAATMALARLLGPLAAVAVVAALLAALAVGAAYLVTHAPWREGEHEDEGSVVVALARDLVRANPLSTVALMGAVGFAAARRPTAAAQIGHGLLRLML